jgi:ELWxxDGT repeat protein
MKKIYALIIALAFFNATSNAQTLFKDLETAANISSNPEAFITINGAMYFVTTGGSSYVHRIWKSDGTVGNTVILKDNVITTNVNSVITLLNVNGTLFYALNKDGSTTSAKNTELWKSDGTTIGTVLVTTLTNADPLSGTGDYPPQNYTVVGNKLFFQMGKGNGMELWVSDGTAQGTMEVIDLAPGNNGGSYKYGGVAAKSMGSYNGKVYFQGTTGLGNNELYVSDGTAVGTTLVKDIRPSTASSDPVGWIVYNNELYFSANDGTNGANGLWKTDGTAGGTVKVFQNTKNCNNTFATLKNELYFVNGIDLWKSDGTTPGTVFVVDSANVINGANSDYLFTQYMKSLSVAPYYRMIYKGTDGTTAGKVSYDVGSSASFILLNNKMYINRADSGTTSAIGLWASDGTKAGTSKLFNASYMGIPYIFNGMVFFSNFGSGIGYELYYYVPTVTGINSYVNNSNSVVYPNPSAGIFNLTSAKMQKGMVSVTSLLGEQVYNEKLDVTAMPTINLSHLTNGIYLLHIADGNIIQTQKIIIQK